MGIFSAVKAAIVPDFLLSLGVEPPPDFLEKNRRSYFIWLFGKPPDLVVEIVSNREGEELTRKLAPMPSMPGPMPSGVKNLRLLSACARSG